MLVIISPRPVITTPIDASQLTMLACRTDCRARVQATIPFQAIATPAGANCVRVGREEPPQLGLHLRPIRFFSCRCRGGITAWGRL